MSDQEPKIVFKSGDDEYPATPETAALFMFVEDKYDHIFIRTGEVAQEGEMHRMIGSYIFKLVQPNIFANSATYMLENEYPVQLNQRIVPMCDIAAFNLAIEQTSSNLLDSEFEIPDDWN